MAVPNRPTAGGVVESAWGVVVHDTVVAQDVQSGWVDLTAPSGVVAGLAVVFPRPFVAGSIPAVVLGMGGASGGTTGGETWVPAFYGASATGFTIRLHRAIAGVATAVRVHWVAIGPRA